VRLPFCGKPPVIKIYFGHSNEIVSKQVVEVVSVDVKWSSTRERNVEVEMAEDLGVSFIELVVIAVTNSFFAALDFDIWIRMASYVSRCKLEPFKNINSD